LRRLVARRTIAKEEGNFKTYSPEVVDEQVENTENDHKHHSTPLSLEAHNNHHTSNRSQKNNHNPSKAPLTSKDKAYEQENQQHTSSELEVHLAVLFVESRETCGGESLAHPRVGKHHQQTSHDRQVTQEEIEVEDEAVAEGLGDDDAEESHDGVFAVLADDDHEGGDAHGDDVGDEEHVGEARGDCL
jgi:hypothetical protein